MEFKKIKVTGTGSPVVDLLANVNDAFINENIKGEKGGMELIEDDEMKKILSLLEGKDFKKAPGGSTGNTIFAMCELGANGALLGKLGKDENSDFYKKALEDAGGDSSYFCFDEESSTAVSICMVTEDAERTMRTNLGAAMKLSTNDITIDDFKEFPLLHTEGYLIFNKELITHVLKTAKEAGCTVSLDLSSFEVVNASKDFLPDLLKNYVDILFANEDEAKAFCDTDNYEKALDIMSEYCEICALKIGSEGSLIKSGNEVFKISPVLCDNPIDTTGAGDYWAAGFLFGYLNDLPMDKCGKIGSILGAEIVSVLGAKLNQDHWGKIKKDLIKL